MRTLVLVLALLAALPCSAQSSGYAVVTLSRERLELSTPCDVGIYLQDQLAARLMPGESSSFNLPPGTHQIRLNLIGAGVCNPGIAQLTRVEVTVQAADVKRYYVTQGTEGLMLMETNPI
jgi:hypothetical protein